MIPKQLKLLITVFNTLLVVSVCAQVKPTVTTAVTGIKVKMNIGETTEIIDKETGQRISYQQYRQRIQTDPYGYHLEPIYNEFGQAEAYTIRATTAEERTTHRFYQNDVSQQPKVGNVIPLFVMTGLDGKTYRSTDLKGKVVVLGFWLTINRPFFNEKQISTLAESFKPYQSPDFIPLGALNSSSEEVNEYLKTNTLPFIPVPDAYGFSKKFQILRFPSFVVIDKTGNVAAFIEGGDNAALKSVLERLTH